MALIHRWPLTANGNDVVGTANLSGSGVTFSANGAATNGSSNYLTGTYPETLTSCSCMVWVNLTQINSTGNEHYAAIKFVEPSFYEGAVCGWYSNYHDKAFLATPHTSSWGGSPSTITSPVNSLFLNKGWKLFLWVWAGTSFSLYDNNTLILSSSGTPTTPSNKVVNVGGGTVFNGWGHYAVTQNVCDARIYNHALSQAEIGALVAAGPNRDPWVTDLPLSRPPLPAVLSCLPASLSRGFR